MTTENIDFKAKSSYKTPLGFPKDLSIVKVITSLTYKRDLVRAIEASGKIEPIEIDTGIGADRIKTENRRNAFETIRNEATSLLNQLNETFIESKSQVKIQNNEEKVLSYAKSEIKSVGSEFKQLLQRKTILTNRLGELESLKRIISQFSELQLDSKLLSNTTSTYTQIIIGTIYKEKLKPLKFDVRETTDDRSILLSQEYTKEETMFLLIFLKSDLEIIDLKLKDAQYISIEPPKGSILSLNEVNDALGAANKEFKEAEDNLNTATKDKGFLLKAILEICNIEITRINEIELRMKKTQTQVIFWGWLPINEQDSFKKSVLSTTNGNAQIEIKQEELDPLLVPSYTPTKPFFSPIREIISSFGTPSRKEIDPFPFVLLLFPIFFGIMFADIAHGFVVICIGLYYRYKKSKNPDYPSDGLKGYLYTGANLFVLMGISSMFFGLIIGSFFGDETILWEIDFLVSIFGAKVAMVDGMPKITETGIFPTWTFFYTLTPTIYHGHATLTVARNYNFFFSFALIVGGITILIGLFIQIYQKYYFRSSFSDGVASVFLLFIYLAILPLIYLVLGFLQLPSTIALTLVAVAFIFIGALLTIEKRSHGAEGMMLSVEHVLSLLSNTISFGRLLALNTVHFIFSFLPYLFLTLLIHGLGGSSSNNLVNHHTGLWAETIGPFYIVWVLAAIIGTLIVVSVETVFSTLQSLRLSWVEFFGKFYTGTGTPFQPVTAERKLTLEQGSSKQEIL